MMKADTQVRSYKNSLTLALSQRERGFWGVVFIGHFKEPRFNHWIKSTYLPDEPNIRTPAVFVSHAIIRGAGCFGKTI